MHAPAPLTTPIAEGDATWFDGRSTRRQSVVLDIQPGGLALRTAHGSSPGRFAWSTVRLSEPMAHAPLSLGLPDGGTLWISRPELARAVRHAAEQATRSRRWAWPGASALIGSWTAVLGCLLATITLLAWFDRQGAAWASQAVVAQLPRSVDTWVGDKIEPQIIENWLAPSQLDRERQAVLRKRYLALAAQAAPGLPVDLRFHRNKPTGPQKEATRQGGFNAMALPNGVVVVLDGLASDLSDDELLWVLGHELGHVVHRHGMQGVARSMGLLAVASTVLGDFSSVAAAAVAGTQRLAHRRDAEREADAFALRWAALAGLPPQTGAQVWRKFMAEERRLGTNAWPAWASTHPASQERLDTASQATSHTPPGPSRPAP